MKENWQQQLQSLLNCDLKTLYPLARSLNRKLEFYVGPTNSGKTYNAMQKLKESGCELFFVIFKKNEPSLRLLNTVTPENTFTIREDSLSTLAVDTLSFLVWCRKKGIDSVIDLELFSRFTALLTGFCGATNRVGFHSFFNEGLYRGDMLTHKVAYNPHIHIAKNFISLTNALLSSAPETPYSKKAVTDGEIKLEKEIGRASCRERVSSPV